MKLGIGAPLFLALTLSACWESTPPRTVIVSCSNGADAGGHEAFEDDKSKEAVALSSPCARACKSFSLLGCPESVKLPAGKTCVETCNSIKGISSFDPECVAKAKTVEAVRKCPEVRCQP